MLRVDQLSQVNCPESVGPGDPGYDLEPGKIYVYAADANKRQAVQFLCPCGCGLQLFFPIRNDLPVPSGAPLRHMHFFQSPNGVTLQPSIRMTKDCKSHFNITDGKVVWHGGSGR